MNYIIENGKKKILKKPELLAPAGNLEKLKTAILYGADAVFVGGKEFSLRSAASNFTLEDIKEAVEFAKAYGSDIHVTCNIILHDDNLEGLEEYLTKLDELGVKAVIVADPYIMTIVKKLGLKLEVHVSTQLSTLNSEAMKFYEKLGAKRVVLGRETEFEDLKTIRNKTDLDLEYFIHGAMCIHYSGRCMLSNYFNKRDANRGGCSQSCRWLYNVYLDGVKQDIMPFTMSSKDMCLSYHITDLIDLGINSFKIEGRMKSLHYIATVVGTYRKIIDHYFEDPDNFDETGYLEELEKAANRAFTTGFFDKIPNEKDQLFNQRDEHPTQDFVLRVLDYNKQTKIAKIEQRNYFKKGDKVEIFSPKHDNFIISIDKIMNENNEEVDVANHPMEVLYIQIEQEVMTHDMGRKVAHE